MAVDAQDTCGSANGSNGNGQHLTACACCMALAQVRMPSFDPAMFQQQSVGVDFDVVPARRKKQKKRGKSIFSIFGGDLKALTNSQNRSESGKSSGSPDEPELWDEQLMGPKPRKFWQGLDGGAVTLLGIALPVFSLALACLAIPKRLTLVLLSHPLESLAELLLIASIPIVNYLVWSSISKNRIRFARASAGGLGAVMGAATFVAGICIAAMFMATGQLQQEIGTDFATGFSLLSLISLMSAAASGYIVYRLRGTRDFDKSKQQVVAFSVGGLLLSVLAFAGAEARPWLIRYTERMAVSSNAAESKEGLAMLRRLNPERELRMECSDPRAAGIAGLFIPVKQSSEHELYFALTGKPYSYREFKNTDLSSLPDDYLSRNVVGDPIIGLGLTRSTLTGSIHPRTLSTAMQWTFVLKNDTPSRQAARAELALPPGAVITGMSRWTNGEPEEASVAASGKSSAAASSSHSDSTHQGLVTDLGHGRLLLHCYPIEPEEQVKVRISMIVPMKAESLATALVPMPQFVASNFSLEGEHQIRLHSPEALNIDAKGLTQERTGPSEYTLAGTIDEAQLHKPKAEIRIAIHQNHPIAAFDKTAVQLATRDAKVREAKLHREQHDTYDHQVFLVFDSDTSTESQMHEVSRALARKYGETVITRTPPHYVVETVERVSAAAPNRLVVVVDGSQTTTQYKDQIAQALHKLPAGIPTSVMIASQENRALTKPIALDEAFKLLADDKFIGGQNNLQTVVSAAELAGETKNGAVLWIHGPQPASNSDIFIMSPYVALPKFYEMTLGTGDVDTVEYFKNHPEIGPFVQIPRNSNSVGDDMATFFGRWSQNSSSYAVKLVQSTSKPKTMEKLTPEESKELLVLQANQRCRGLFASKEYDRAAEIAVRYGFVSPVSSMVLDATPHLQGATNGTIGPQGGDATTIMGVNTAGTVRVNNLANLEALLNIIANVGQMVFGLGGLILIINGLSRSEMIFDLMGDEVEITPGQRIGFGVFILLAGLSAPGILNWFVASARDANLFS